MIKYTIRKVTTIINESSNSQEAHSEQSTQADKRNELTQELKELSTSQSPEQTLPDSSEIKKIKVEDLENAETLPDRDGTLITLQVNARDIRDPESSDLGVLKPEAKVQAQVIAENFFTSAFEAMTPEERRQVDIIVFASNARLTTPSGLDSQQQRGVQTGDAVLGGIRTAMEEFDIGERQLINNISSVGGGAFEVSDLIDLEILNGDNVYMKYLKGKYMPEGTAGDLSLNSGTGLSPVSEEALWVAYETDAPEDRAKRLELGAEGPEDIADRVNKFVKTIERYAEEYHRLNPGRRVMVWAVGHYDNISPFLKKYVLDKPMDTYLGVEKNAGVSIGVDAEGIASSTIQGQKFSIQG